MNIVISSGVWVFFNVFSMYLVTGKTGGIFGWSRGELILVTCLYNVVIGVFGFFFVRSMSEFSELVNTGKFDLFLLKPVDSQFYISTHYASLQSFIRTILGTLLAIFVCVTFNIVIQPVNILFFVFAAIAGILLLYSLLFFLNTFVIWTPKIDNITELFYTLRSMGRFPRQTFKQISEVFFIFASPFVIILSTPARILLGKSTSYEILELLILTAVSIIGARLFWKFALRYYTSASS